ncbi:hypothetical protein MARPU_08575 [Marichromatium purpuratum 984]|uniref:Phosphotyrosine protein phosphatase n=1 Tax=Marichromatium purpuratum 984 TaxID=765910 RepID=W0E3W5_MARPU|nr:protein tyrosine phosphatase family protein [Marichromatium purpuratum]AHF03914.1 hypothetical protein MARPU_08575 [Marichromatium purpuratum 984]
MDAENTHQVFDWLWTSGQLSEADIAALPRLGVDTVINLAPPTAHNALPGEAEHITALGLSYIQIPVDWEQPQISDYQTFSVLLRALQREGRRVWVHCARNMRVSAFVYLYRRIELGEAEEVARFPMREVWVGNGVWGEFIAVCMEGVD